MHIAKIAKTDATRNDCTLPPAKTVCASANSKFDIKVNATNPLQHCSCEPSRKGKYLPNRAPTCTTIDATHTSANSSSSRPALHARTPSGRPPDAELCACIYEIDTSRARISHRHRSLLVTQNTLFPSALLFSANDGSRIQLATSWPVLEHSGWRCRYCKRCYRREDWYTCGHVLMKS